MTKVQLAYAAGIIDGEGSIRLPSHGGGRRSGAGWSVVVQVGNTDWALLLWLQKTFGAGRVYNLPVGPRRKPAGRWIVVSKQAEVVLRAVRPYLMVKARQADVALAYRVRQSSYRRGFKLTVAESNKRIALREQLRALNQRGVAS